MAEKTGDGISKEGYLRENYRYFHLRDTSGSEHDFHFHEFAKAVLLQSGRAEYIVEQSILMKEQCEKYGLPYYETARNREQAIQRFLKDFGLAQA